MPVMHIHLDPVGGVAGDMFAAALLDAFPALAAELPAALARAGIDRYARVELRAHHDQTLTGSRLVVIPGPEGEGASEPADGHHRHAHHHHHHDHDHHHHDDAHDHHHHDHGADGHHHHHRTWREVRAILEAADLPLGCRSRAIDIFRLLAEAEGRVHGVDPADVAFHEVGAWDSIADVVCAAWIADRLDGATWSSGPLPMGSGHVHTAHGRLPVPAPATALLMEGMTLVRDDHPGERVTPTGAAIIRHLAPRFEPAAGPMRLRASGIGFGTKVFPGMSNILRALVLETGADADAIATDTVSRLAFEVDDQTGEDLALALDRIRTTAGCLDVSQWPVTGKKGRIAVHVQVLAAPAAEDALVRRCLAETTTLGVRVERVARRVLAREEPTVSVDGASLRVKRARRPDGQWTTKVAIDDLGRLDADHAARQRMRRRAEDEAAS